MMIAASTCLLVAHVSLISCVILFVQNMFDCFVVLVVYQWSHHLPCCSSWHSICMEWSQATGLLYAIWQKSGEKVREKWGDGKTAKKGGQSDAVWGCTAFGAIMRGLRHLLQMEKWIMGDYGRFSRHDLGHFPREGRCHLYAILLRWDSAIYFHYDVYTYIYLYSIFDSHIFKYTCAFHFPGLLPNRMFLPELLLAL